MHERWKFPLKNVQRGFPYDVINYLMLNNSYFEIARKLKPLASSLFELVHDIELIHLMTS